VIASGDRLVETDRGSARVIAAGSGAGAPVVLLQGSVPGVTPYCGGVHLWGRALAGFAAHGPVIAMDLPGAGGTAVGEAARLTIPDMAKHVLAVIAALKLPRCHVVGHDLGGLVALQIAMDAPAALASVAIVASPWAAPSGDGVENLTLAHPPAPLWSAPSQYWALDRLSYTPAHIDEALLKAGVEAGAGFAHRQAAELMTAGAHGDIFMPSVMKAKSRFFATARSGGIVTPMQIVWAANDPMSSVDHGLWLFRIVGAHQGAAQYHLVNRSGSFVFREQTEQFLEIVTSFQAGVMADATD
jgi:pimeloyl-ACP methyl ester carboxylesterase